MLHIAHNVNHSEVDAQLLTAATLARIHTLTRADEVLYATALSRLYADVRRVEKEATVAILCGLVEKKATPTALLREK